MAKKISEKLLRRQRARRRALQAVYQWQMTGHETKKIISQFNAEQNMSNVDQELFAFLLRSVINLHEELDAKLQPFLDRPIEQLDQTERAILRISTVELLYSLEVPVKVVLNEAIDLAHRFGAEQSHTYINGVLDKAATDWRSVEIAAEKTQKTKSAE